MNNDIVDTKERVYCHAKIDRKGFISIQSQIFHRGYTINSPGQRKFQKGVFEGNINNVPVFWNLKDAIESLDSAPKFFESDEVFVIQFPENETAETFWFVNEEATERLNTFKTCYGQYSVSIYRKD